jgi:tripartite-type tricarboxylate transporter receptor subunit TctC
MINRRLFTTALACTGASSLAMLSARASAQAIPLAKILCGFPAGGTADALSRRLAERMRPGYAATVVVDNRPGAGGQIAMTTLRDSAADGTVLCVTPSSLLAMNPHTFRKLPYRPQSDSVAVSLLCDFDHALAVGPAVPASVTTVKDFLAWAKGAGGAGYGTPGAAGIPHLVGVMVARTTGVDLVNVAYRGSAPALNDLMGGQVPAVIAPLGDFLPYLGTGKVRLLAVAGPSRSRFAPNTPTLRESGVDVAARDWFGVFMPPRTPPELVARAAAGVRAAVDSPELKSAFAQIAMEAATSTPAALAQRVTEEDASWGRIIAAVGFQPE